MVTPIPPDRFGRGGVPLVLDGQLHGLLRAHHDVTVLTVAGPDPSELASLATLRDAGIDVEAIERREPQGGARWQRRARFASLWLSGLMPWRSVWFWDGRTQVAIERLVNRDRFDLVAVEDNAMAAYRYGREVPTVLTEYEVRRPRPVRRPEGGLTHLPRWALNELDWRRWAAYQREGWRAFDRLQVFGGRDAAVVAEMAPELRERLRTVPFGLRLPTPVPGAAERPDSLLFMGNFTHVPNVEGITWWVREVLPAVRRLRPSVTLTVAGSQPPASVRALARPGITLVEDPAVVEPLIAAAAVVLAPLRIGGGMRVKVAQALGHGKAVVATTRAIDGLPAQGLEAPCVVSDDPHVQARHISRLLEDEAGRRALGARARRFAERHLSAEAYGRRLTQSYAEVLDAHQSRR